MYGSYHPLFARHLILEHAYHREAAREPRAAVVPNDPPARRTRPVRPRTPITWFVAPLVTFVVGVTVVAALGSVDPSQASSTSQPYPQTCSPTDKVRSLQSCVPSLQVA